MFSEIHAHIHAHELARTHISIVLIRFTYFSSPLLCCVLIDFYRCLLCCPLGSYMPINIGELEIEGRMTEISFVCNSCVRSYMPLSTVSIWSELRKMKSSKTNVFSFNLNYSLNREIRNKTQDIFLNF